MTLNPRTAFMIAPLLLVLLLPAAARALSPSLTLSPLPPPPPLPLPRPSPRPPRQCLWLDYNRNPNLTSYEFQLQPHRGFVWEFEAAAAALERVMRRLSKESRDNQRIGRGRRRWPTLPANFTFVEGSRWDVVVREHAFAVSSRRGRPLHPSRFPHDAPDHPFPWKRLAYLRLRRYIVSLPHGVPGAPPPGSADLALKMKKVDPALGPRQPGIVFKDGVRAKLEADVHCDHQRVSVSPLYAPVPAGLNISRVGNVREWYPNLDEVARIAGDEILPFCHAVWRRKATWTVAYRGLMGELGLMAKYNTTLGDALAGRRAKNGELSLRIRRDGAAVSREGESEGERLEALYEAMDALAMAAQRFRDEGWDGKTPAAGVEGEHGAEGDDDDDVVCERSGGGPVLKAEGEDRAMVASAAAKVIVV